MKMIALNDQKRFDPCYRFLLIAMYMMVYDAINDEGVAVVVMGSWQLNHRAQGKLGGSSFVGQALWPPAANCKDSAPFLTP